MTEAEFFAAILRNPNNEAILARLPSLGLQDCWLVSGALFQTVWNVRCSMPPGHGIADYDLFYFDPDLSYEAEDSAIARAGEIFADLPISVQLRNQARVHLWYEQKFGKPYPPLTRATDGIDRFLMLCSQVGVRPRGTSFELYAPHGLDDLAAMIVRPNLTANYSQALFLEKVRRWQSLWPRLAIVTSPDRSY
jgi:hypothetical protein